MSERDYDDAIIDWLNSSGWIAGKPPKWKRLKKSMADVMGIRLIRGEIRVVAIEVKANDNGWGPKEIAQAAKNRDFAHYCYLANNYKSKLNDNVIDDARRWGIGLIILKSKKRMELVPGVEQIYIPNPPRLNEFLKKNNFKQCSICRSLTKKAIKLVPIKKVLIPSDFWICQSCKIQFKINKKNEVE